MTGNRPSGGPGHVLIVTPTVPYPPDWGFGIRVFQIVSRLAVERRVSVLCYAHEGDDDKRQELSGYCEAVYTVPSPIESPADKRWLQLRSLVSRRTYQAASLDTGPMQAELERVVADQGVDLIQFESSQMAALDAPAGVPWVLDEHNIEYELLHRMYRTERSPLRKLYNWAEFRKFRREEVGRWRAAGGCVMTSEREADVVRQLAPHTPLHVAANGVDPDYFTSDGTPGDPDSIVFTGVMNYRPNIDAVQFFVDQVLPRIVSKRPTAVFSVVGQGAPPEVTRLAGPNVRIVGAVPDVRPYIRGGGALVVPLRMGSGTRLKVLEGLSARRGMVSTTVGCEGIDAVHGEHLLVADDPGEFADAVLALLEDQELGARLGQAGRVLVEDRYGWASIVRGLSEFHGSVVGG